MDWEEHRANKTLKGIHYMNRHKTKCRVCDLYLCICQSILHDFEFETKVKVKEANPVRECPHNCANESKLCLACYNYDKFKMMVALK